MNTTKLNKLSKSILIAGLLSIVALPAAASKHYNKGYNYGHNNSHKSGHYNKAKHAPVSYDYARVVDVQPVFETYQVNHPVEQCYEKQVPVNHGKRYGNGNGSYTNEIIGGVIGGVIGNRIGKRGGGNARDVATVVGAVLGASVANDIERSNNRKHSSDGHYQKTVYKTVQHCEIKDSYTTERKIVGYDVAYKYNGKTFYTQADQHPGKRIRVQVAVRPA